jgi:hypothetical protein
MRRYAASRKIAGSNPDEVIEFLSVYLILPATALGPGVYSAFNRSKYQKIFPGVKHGRRVRLTT